MNRKMTVIKFIPGEVDAKKPLDGAHEIDRNLGGEDFLEFSLNGRVFGEIYKVVNVETDCNWKKSDCVSRIGRVLNETRVNTWIVEIGLKRD